MEVESTMLLPSLSCWTACAVFLIILIYFYVPYWKVRLVPGPPPRFLVGHLHLLGKHGPDVFRALAKEYGPIFRFHMGRQPLVMVADAELCKEVGIKKFKDIKNRSRPPPTIGSTLHQNALFLSRDEAWSAMRNTIVPLYQPVHLAKLIPVMQTYINSLSSNISASKDQEYVLFCKLSLKMAIDIIGKTAFGIDFGLSNEGSELRSAKNDDIHEFLKEYEQSMEYLTMDLSSSVSTISGLFFPCLQVPLKQLFKAIPGTADYKMRQIEHKLCRRIDALVVQKLRDEKRRSSLDFLSAILNARDSVHCKNHITDKNIRALAYEHLLTGTRTTAFTISSAVYLVSKHPDVERKLLQEIDNFGPPSKVPTPNDLQHGFPYLDQVIREAMRFYTVSPLIAREASQQVEIGGYVLPKGTYVWLAPGVLSKDAHQFPQPDEFRPERFDPSGEEERQRHPYAHIPFGIGPRACIGQKFAIQQIKLTIIHLYQRYTFRHSPLMESPIELQFDLVCKFKHGIKLMVIPRQLAHCAEEAS